MHVHLLDTYHAAHSPVHHLDARVKLGISLGFIVSCALTPSGAWPIFILLWAILSAGEILTGLGVIHFWKRSALALPFVLAAVPLLFSIPVENTAPLFQLNLGQTTLTASQAGFTRLSSITLKSWISVQAAIWLTSSTAFPEILRALRAIHIPQLLVSMIGLMWRYLSVLVDEALRLMRARDARSGIAFPKQKNTGGRLTWRARVTGGMAGALMIRSLERSERIYTAMLSRGYDGETRAMGSRPLPANQRSLLGFSLAILLMITLAAQLFNG